MSGVQQLVDQVHRSFVLQTVGPGLSVQTVNCDSQLVLDAFRDVEPVQL